MSDTKQINVRLPLELHKALDDHKVKTGEDKSDVVKRGIEWALDLRYVAPSALELQAMRNGKPRGDTVELAAWLAERTGLPRALCRRRITDGRVKVSGQVFSEDRLEKDHLQDVSLDGQHVKPSKA
jgi:predicted DNA-binding protein